MRRTTQTVNKSPAGPLADAGPYDYDLPVARGAAQQPPAPRHAPASKGWSRVERLAFILVNVSAYFLQDVTGWSLLRCYLILYAPYTLLWYWSEPRPATSFPRWALRAVGVWLNCYVGFVTVPVSLRGWLPDSLAFGLPAFLVMAALYPLSPVHQGTGRQRPFWQWLLFAASAAVCWAYFGPSFFN